MRNETEVALLARYKELSEQRMKYISTDDKARANLIMKEMVLLIDALGTSNEAGQGEHTEYRERAGQSESTGS